MLNTDPLIGYIGIKYPISNKNSQNLLTMNLSTILTNLKTE